MIALLSRRGTQRLVGDVLRDNTSMRELARALGFAVDATASDGEAIRFVLTLPRADEATPRNPVP